MENYQEKLTNLFQDTYGTVNSVDEVLIIVLAREIETYMEADKLIIENGLITTTKINTEIKKKDDVDSKKIVSKDDINDALKIRDTAQKNILNIVKNIGFLPCDISSKNNDKQIDHLGGFIQETMKMKVLK